MADSNVNGVCCSMGSQYCGRQLPAWWIHLHHVLLTGTGEVLSVADASPCQRSEHGRAQPQPQQDVRSIAAAHAAGWRRRFALPQDVRRLPSVLSNASVLATGQSVDQLRHPWLPMCLTGYKAAAQHPT